MFTTPCFIRKNTPELREKLNSLGHKLNHGKVWGKCLCVFKTEDSDEWRYVATPLSDLNSMPNFDNAIDCGGNVELFLAIAALRDDSNEHQWFVWDDDKNDGDIWKLYDDDPNWSWWIFEAHIATVEELIKHFK